MKKGLLGRLADNNPNKEDNSFKKHIQTNNNSDVIPFEFEGKNYYLAERDNILIFDSNMLLIHTLKKDDSTNTDVPLFLKAYDLLTTKKDAPTVKLFIKRDGSFEKISFYNRFDAIFILKKLRRVAARPDENIAELFIEDNGALVEHHKISPQRRLSRGFGRNKKETDVVVKLSDIENVLEAIISDSINNEFENVDNDKINHCIELLEALKTED